MSTAHGVQIEALNTLADLVDRVEERWRATTVALGDDDTARRDLEGFYECLYDAMDEFTVCVTGR